MKAKCDVRASSGDLREEIGDTYFSGFCRKFVGSYLIGWERSFPTDLSHLWSVENPNPVIHLIMNESGVAVLLERSRYLIRSKH